MTDSPASTKFLSRIEDQPDFPRVDLTPQNAEFLALVFPSDRLLRTWHNRSEYAYPIFTTTHWPLVKAVAQFYPDAPRMTNVNLGIRAIEAMTLVVGALPILPDIQVLSGNVSMIINPDNVDGVREYFEDAVSDFRTEMPRTIEVISEISEHHSSDRDLAVLGGAIARQFTLHGAKD